MAIIADVDFTWSPVVTLTTDEIWQSRGNTAFISTTPSPAADDGIKLREGEAIRLSGGLQIQYRKIGPDPVEIAREAI